MPKHPYAINVLMDELERVNRNIIYLQRCITKIEKNDAYRGRPAVQEDHTLRLKNSLKEQTKNAVKLKKAIKILEDAEE